MSDIRLLRVRGVTEATGLAKSTIYRMMSQGRFPRPVTLGAKVVAWPKHEIDRWVGERIAERDKPATAVA